MRSRRHLKPDRRKQARRPPRRSQTATKQAATPQQAQGVRKAAEATPSAHAVAASSSQATRQLPVVRPQRVTTEGAPREVTQPAAGPPAAAPHQQAPVRTPQSAVPSAQGRRRWQPVAALVASAAIAATGMGILSTGTLDPALEDLPGVVSEAQHAVRTHVENVDELFVSPYDWDRLRVDDKGRYVYLGDVSIVSRAGIDVSEHQQDIDWQGVASDGIEFAIIRVGYRGVDTGALAKDATFDYNIQQARAAGIDVGVYFYSLATTADEAREEAAFAVNALEGMPLDYPVVFDIEPTTETSERLEGLTKDQMTEIAEAFCEQVESMGYTACVYGNQTDLSRFHLMRLARHGYWYAQYDARPNMTLRFALWQYTQQGTVAGIQGDVDLDLDLTAVLNAS